MAHLLRLDFKLRLLPRLRRLAAAGMIATACCLLLLQALFART